MARFYGKVGFGTTVDKGLGIWEDVIVEKFYRGDVVRDSRSLTEGQSVNDDISVGNSIRIVADAYAGEHIYAMRYVEWQGARWKITEVENVRPRLLLRLGGIYNGPPPTP